MSEVDAVVVSYRTPEDLAGFLESWEACADPTDHLTVVLVAPRPADEAVASRSGHDVIMLGANVGYGRACNIAVSDLGVDVRPVVALFNADTRLSPGILGRTADRMVANDWAIAGPRQVDDLGRLTHAGITGTNTRCAPRAWKRPDTDPSLWQVEPVVSVSGSAYFIRSDVWWHLSSCGTYRRWLNSTVEEPGEGAFLPTPLYYEETWCSYHARAHGYKVMYLGDEVMVHRWHKAVEAAGLEPSDKFTEAQRMFRSACEVHNIEHD